MDTLTSRRVALSPKQLAAVKGVHVNTVYEWMKLDGFPIERAGIRGWVSICVSEFENWRKTNVAAEALRSI